MSDLEPEICNCGALRQAARRVTKFYDDALAPSGLSVNQFSILARLNLVGPSTIQELARLLVMDRSTLGHLLRPLERRSLEARSVRTRSALPYRRADAGREGGLGQSPSTLGRSAAPRRDCDSRIPLGGCGNHTGFQPRRDLRRRALRGTHAVLRSDG